MMMKVLVAFFLVAANAKNTTVNELAPQSSVAKFLSSKSIEAMPAPMSSLSSNTLDMTSAGMEKAIAELMSGKTAFGATPMGGSVRQISDILVKTMMPKVTAAHKVDQARLKEGAAAIKKCGSVKTTQLRKAVAPNRNYHTYSRLHKTCRNQEAIAYSSKKSCGIQERSLLNIKKLKCKIFAQASGRYATQQTNSVIVRKSGREAAETYLRRISSTFCGSHSHGAKGQHSRKGGWGGGLRNSMLDKFLKAKGECQRATRVYKAKVKECKRKAALYKQKKGKCNQYQGLMDSNSCKNAVTVKDACESYAGCYSAKRKEFQTSQTRALLEERDRKAEWRGLKRMSCLISAFADGKVSNNEINACKKATHSTSHLTLKRYRVPPLQRCSIPTLYPATGPYKRREIAPLPALAKGKKSAECSGVKEISLTPASGSPRSCKCTRVTLNGFYSAGAMVRCTNCRDVRRSRERNSCPTGTKLFSPATRTDWKTFIASARPLRAPHWIIDVTRPQNGCGGCTRNPMHSGNGNQRSWRTSDGSPWWLRSTKYGEPNGDYHANCYLGIRAAPRENQVTFNDHNCRIHSKSYYCQTKRANLKPARGSPRSCKCTRVQLSGRYSAGSLVRCQGCLNVYRSTQKNSCPNGMKIFSPKSRQDWQTVLDSGGTLAAPHFIVDITRPQNGCGGCRSPMKSTNPRQASWRTSDGSAWWMRNSGFGEPNGDYHANCYMGLYHRFPGANNVRMNDHRCAYHSSSYYCQPKKRKPRVARRPPTPSRILVRTGLLTGLKEEIYYYNTRLTNVPRLGVPNAIRRDRYVWQGSTGGKWAGMKQSNRFAVRWTGLVIINKAGNYKFQLTSDDGSKLYIDNSFYVNNNGLHGMRARNSRNIRLVKGQHWVRVEFFEEGGGAGCLMKYVGPDTGNRWSRVNNLKTPTIRGFKEEVYYGVRNMNRIPNMNALKPSLSRFVAQVNYRGTGGNWPGLSQRDNFAVRWTGNLRIDRTGTYRWSIISDDGSKLWIRGRYVINNDGLHGMRNREVSYGTANMNSIRLEFFERGGGAGMIFRYFGPDTRNRMVVVPQSKMSAL